jgi:hypothetical protein
LPEVRQLWAARLLVGCVTAWNLQAALAFLFAPALYAPSFELSGAAGQAAVRGIAVLFIMWNVPYLLAAWHPRRFLLSLKEAALMQAVGLLGETSILLSLESGHAVLHASILRFIIFDAGGLVLLLLALWTIASQAKTEANRAKRSETVYSTISQ